MWEIAQQSWNSLDALPKNQRLVSDFCPVFWVHGPLWHRCNACNWSKLCDCRSPEKANCTSCHNPVMVTMIPFFGCWNCHTKGFISTDTFSIVVTWEPILDSWMRTPYPTPPLQLRPHFLCPNTRQPPTYQHRVRGTLNFLAFLQTIISVAKIGLRKLQSAILYQATEMGVANL